MFPHPSSPIRDRWQNDTAPRHGETTNKPSSAMACPRAGRYGTHTAAAIPKPRKRYGAAPWRDNEQAQLGHGVSTRRAVRHQTSHRHTNTTQTRGGHTRRSTTRRTDHPRSSRTRPDLQCSAGVPRPCVDRGGMTSTTRASSVAATTHTSTPTPTPKYVMATHTPRHAHHEPAPKIDRTTGASQSIKARQAANKP